MKKTIEKAIEILKKCQHSGTWGCPICHIRKGHKESCELRKFIDAPFEKPQRCRYDRGSHYGDCTADCDMSPFI